MPWPEETIQYQDSILPQSRNLLQQQQRQCTENASTEEDRWSARFLLLGAAALYGTNFAMILLRIPRQELMTEISVTNRDILITDGLRFSASVFHLFFACRK